MLIAQERLAQSEFEYLQSQLTYNLALVNLKKATGTLLQYEQVAVGRACICGLPTNLASKPEIIYQEASAPWQEHQPSEEVLPGIPEPVADQPATTQH